MALAIPPIPATRNAEDDFDPPLPFGRYQLSRRLGHGGFATVFLALEASVSGEPREVVLKRLHEHLAMDERSREAFLDEARLALSMNHPNVVAARDFGSIEGRPFLAMEYLLGTDLERVLERLRSQQEQLRPELVTQIAIDVLEGLAYLHERRDAQGRPAPVVHRDVSPHNLFVTQAGVVKLLDFGIAKARARAIETTTGVVKGKFAYMSPEQASGESAQPSADVWSMGVVLWEMLAGQRLFEASSAFSTLASSFLGAVPRLDQVGTTPKPLADVVERALARSPAQRYANGREMLEAVRALPMAIGTDRSQVAELVTDLFGPAIDRAREESELRRVKARSTPPRAAAPRARRVPTWLLALGLCALSAFMALALQRKLEPRRLAPRTERITVRTPGPVVVPAPQVAPVAPVTPAPATESSTPRAPRSPARAVQAAGTLSLVTVPWSHVRLGGRRIGTTPLIGLPLPGGAQRLVLENPSVVGARRLDVDIAAGRELSVRVELASLPLASP